MTTWLSFVFENVCQTIYEATKGWGANKQKVIDALATKDAVERYKLALRYKELQNMDLAELMKKEFSGDFGNTMVFLAMPLHEAECAMIKKACAGIGAAANVIWSICCGRTNEEMELLKKTYFKLYTKDLGKLLASELHGDMERYVLICFLFLFIHETLKFLNCFLQSRFQLFASWRRGLRSSVSHKGQGYGRCGDHLQKGSRALGNG